MSLHYFHHNYIRKKSVVKIISYFTTCSLHQRRVLHHTLPNINLKNVPLFSRNFFFIWISFYLQGFQWLDDKIKESNLRVSDLFHKIFLSLTKSWLKRLTFLYQGFQSISTPNSNEVIWLHWEITTDRAYSFEWSFRNGCC